MHLVNSNKRQNSMTASKLSGLVDLDINKTREDRRDKLDFKDLQHTGLTSSMARKASTPSKTC